MSKSLIVIESPNKIKTLSKYLGNDYEIIATVGHIRDLAKNGLGFDQKTFDPRWVTISEKEKIIDEINKTADHVDEVFIATDPDREGEAIAWHVYESLNKKNQKKCKRITFNEITKQAVLNSIENKRDINENWVYSQFTRRILDRIIGFKLSSLIQNKLKAESAGRVQSVALKFICDREKEIENFVPIQWYNLDVVLINNISLTLKSINPKYNDIKPQVDIKKNGFNFQTFDDANLVLSELDDECEIIEIGKPVQVKLKSKPVFKTSTLQQDGINKLNMSAKEVTLIAQKLYEGIEVDNNQIALITYPRTDSLRMSDIFLKHAFDFIKDKYGEEYVGTYENKNNPKNANIQDAHEAIRPVDLTITPESIKGKINNKEWKLYNLIYLRTIANLMANAVYEKITITLKNNENEFSVSSRTCKFDGYKKVWNFDDEEDVNNEYFDLKNLKLKEKIKIKKASISQHETQPPLRFTQASLIFELEKAGVGRPSTYNKMVNVVLERDYASLENKSFILTDTGKKVNSELNKYFNKEINKNFTKDMEERLDKIANGSENWKEWLITFYPYFDDQIKNAWSKMEKTKDELVGRKCPRCENELVYKKAKRSSSKFIGCSSYPKCNYIEPLEKPKLLEELCPECNKNLIIRKNKKGSQFIACSGYPDCRYLISMKNFNKEFKKK